MRQRDEVYVKYREESRGRHVSIILILEAWCTMQKVLGLSEHVLGWVEQILTSLELIYNLTESERSLTGRVQMTMTKWTNST